MSPDDQQVLLLEEGAFKALVADVRGIIQASQGRISRRSQHGDRHDVLADR